MGFDVDSVVEAALASTGKNLRKSKKKPDNGVVISLDTGVTSEMLYLCPSDSGESLGGVPLNTGAAPGKQLLRPLEAQTGPERAGTRGVRPGGGLGVRADPLPVLAADALPHIPGTAAAPLDGSKERRKALRLEKAEKLDGWFGIRRKEMTPELRKELLALKLRGFHDPKRFYKANDSDKLPTHFQIGTVVGGMKAVGAGDGSRAAGYEGRKRKKGQSFLQELLHDEKSESWTTKRYKAVNDRGEEGGKNHYAARKMTAAPKWKKKGAQGLPKKWRKKK